MKYFFKNSFIRELYSKKRYEKLVQKGLRTKNSKNSLMSDYSKDAFGNYCSIPNRIDYLIGSVASLKPNKSTELLSIGPRFESELFGYRGIGISRKSITAIDTYSYSPMIETGDAHNLRFESNKFDIVVIGWTIAYSSQPKKLISEALRVLRKNGYAIITFDLQNSINKYMDKSFPKNKVLIPLVNKKSYFLSNSSSNYNIKSFELETKLWSGAISKTPIGKLVLEKI